MTTNLLPIQWLRDEIYSAKVPAGNAPSVLGPAWKTEVWCPPGTLKAGRYWSLYPFPDNFTRAVSASDIQKIPIGEVLVDSDLDTINVLKETIVRTLVASRSQLRWHALKRLAYFRRQDDHRNVEYVWRHGQPRSVVQARFSKDAGSHFTGYRHDAARLSIRELPEEWALQIVPTYLFTWDGKQVSGHHDKALAGIKRFDRHRAVSSSLRMWEHLLTKPLDLLTAQPEPAFQLGSALRVDVPVSVRDDDWIELPPKEAEEAQGTIFDLADTEQ